MAKYVLLTFENDKDADTFVDDTTEEDDFKIRAVYKKPTQFCSCIPGRKGGFTRGKKYGWWVHDQCGKPRKAWAEGDHWYTALGKNLLPVTIDAPEWRGEHKRGHVWDETLKEYVSVFPKDA